MSDSEETLGPGALLDGRYRLERRLGVGGHGTVWLATDESADGVSLVAVKLLAARLVQSEEVRRRFRAEAAILQTLRHPGIVRALDLSTFNERLYIVMEYLPGRSLAQEMVDRAREERAYTLTEVGQRFDQICAAVAGAHGMGVVHRDLKPQNAIVMERGDETTVKVLDFGIAKLLGRPGEDETTLGRMLGSYLYTSPEQVSGKPVDARADVFALGCILFELLTLRRAWAMGADGQPVRVGERGLRFEGPNTFLSILRRIVGGPRPVPSQYREGLPEGIDTVVARALEVTPEARFPTVDALQAAFQEATQPGHRAWAAPADEAPDTRVSEAPPAFTVAEAEVSNTLPDTNVIARSPEATRLLAPPLPHEEGWSRWPRWVGQGLVVAASGLAGAGAYHLWLQPSSSPEAAAPDAAPPAVRVIPRPAGSPSPDEKSATLDGPRGPDPARARSAKTPRPRAKRSAPPPTRVTPGKRAPDRLEKLRRAVAKLRLEPDVEALERISIAIQRAARALDDKVLGARIERLAVASATTGDLEGLTQCIALLAEADADVRRSQR